MLAPFLMMLVASGATSETVTIRGARQQITVYRPAQTRDVPPVVLTSGDGGWRGFIIDVAVSLAGRGHYVAGVNAQAYLSSLSRDGPLEPVQIGQDYGEFIRFARERGGKPGAAKVLLIGWSEGAGLSLLAAADKENQPHLAGLIAIGLPEWNELAWRLRDSIIFLTKKVPNEKTFNSKDYIALASPVPLAMLQSTHDDFVPLETARELYRRAKEPKQLHLIEASNHRFAGRREEFFRKLAEAVDWALKH